MFVSGKGPEVTFWDEKNLRDHVAVFKRKNIVNDSGSTIGDASKLFISCNYASMCFFCLLIHYVKSTNPAS